MSVNDDEEAAAIELSYALLREIRDTAEANGARFALLVIPDQLQVEPDVVVYGVPDVLHRVQDYVGRFGEQEDVPVIDPMAALRRIREQEDVPLYFRIDRHLNPVGHRRVAEILREELLGLGWLGQSTTGAASVPSSSAGP